MRNLFFNPVKIISGAGCVRDFDGYADLGSRCLIVCGRSSARLSGALDDLTGALSKAGVKASVFDRVEENPTVETCHAAGEAAREAGAQFIIGVGGGSPLDAAKAAAAFAANPHLKPEELYDGEHKSDPLPIIAIPTTAGTGSEVTPYSVLTVHSISNKKTFKTPKIYPKVALLDAAYTVTLPQSITAATAADALSHAVEGYFAKVANPVSDALAEKAMFYVGRGLRALNDGRLDSSLREKLLIGSTIAGLVISVTGTSFVHSTGYPLTYFEGVSHGAANAYFLADYVGYMSSVAPEREAKVYRICGVRSNDEFRELISAAVPPALRFDRDTAVKYARIGAEGRSAKNSVFEPSIDDVYLMFKRYIK